MPRPVALVVGDVIVTVGLAIWHAEESDVRLQPIQGRHRLGIEECAGLVSRRLDWRHDGSLWRAARPTHRVNFAIA